MRSKSRLLLAAFLISSAHANPLAAQAWKDTVRSQLETLIVPSQVSSDRLRITQQGTVLLVNVEGISASPGGDKTYLKNTLHEGHVQQASGFGAMFSNKNTNRDYKVGEKVYMFKNDINDDDIALFLISQETSPIQVDGKTVQSRYKALLHVEFPKGTLSSMPPATFREIVTSALKLEGEATAPKTVELGQTTAQVEAAFGKPDKILKIGAKTIYVYKDVKVTFVNGKVSDVQ